MNLNMSVSQIIGLGLIVSLILSVIVFRERINKIFNNQHKKIAQNRLQSSEKTKDKKVKKPKINSLKKVKSFNKLNIPIKNSKAHLKLPVINSNKPINGVKNNNNKKK